MKCMCCGKNANVRHLKSRLTRGVKHLLCEDCIDHEPRHWIVLVARTSGVMAVSQLVKSHRYCGDDIRVSEVI